MSIPILLIQRGRSVNSEIGEQIGGWKLEEYLRDMRLYERQKNYIRET